MKTGKFNYLLISVSLVFAACGERQEVSTVEQAPPETATAVAGIPKYSAEDFFETTSYGLVGPAAHAYSSDGASLLVSSDGTGVFNAYALPLDGEPAVQLTESDDNAVFAVSWFPGDLRILYTYDSGGNELNHVIVREEDGSSEDLTPGENLKAAFVRWCDDGQNFYLLTTERDPRNFDIYRYSTEDYSRDLVYENPGYQIADISGDGRWVVVEKPRSSADTDLLIVDLASDSLEPVLITEHTGNISHSAIGIAPGNEMLLYLTDEHGEFAQAWTHELETGAKSLLVEAPWDVSYVVYSHSGRYRVSGVNADARTVVSILDIE